MYVHYGVCAAGVLQLGEQMVQQRLAIYGNKCFGHRVGEGTQPSAQSGCKYHRFHFIGLSIVV